MELVDCTVHQYQRAKRKLPQKKKKMKNNYMHNVICLFVTISSDAGTWHDGHCGGLCTIIVRVVITCAPSIGRQSLE